MCGYRIARIMGPSNEEIFVEKSQSPASQQILLLCSGKETPELVEEIWSTLIEEVEFISELTVPIKEHNVKFNVTMVAQGVSKQTNT